MAHCIESPDSVKDYLEVEIGLHNRLAADSWSISRKINKIFIHEKYNYVNKHNGLQNDIAILKLSVWLRVSFSTISK